MPLDTQIEEYFVVARRETPPSEAPAWPAFSTPMIDADTTVVPGDRDIHIKVWMNGVAIPELIGDPQAIQPSPGTDGPPFTRVLLWTGGDVNLSSFELVAETGLIVSSVSRGVAVSEVDPAYRAAFANGQQITATAQVRAQKRQNPTEYITWTISAPTTGTAVVAAPPPVAVSSPQPRAWEEGSSNNDFSVPVGAMFEEAATSYDIVLWPSGDPLPGVFTNLSTTGTGLSTVINMRGTFPVGVVGYQIAAKATNANGSTLTGAAAWNVVDVAAPEVIANPQPVQILDSATAALAIDLSAVFVGASTYDLKLSDGSALPAGWSFSVNAGVMTVNYPAEATDRAFRLRGLNSVGEFADAVLTVDRVAAGETITSVDPVYSYEAGTTRQQINLTELTSGCPTVSVTGPASGALPGVANLVSVTNGVATVDMTYANNEIRTDSVEYHGTPWSEPLTANDTIAELQAAGWTFGTGWGVGTGDGFGGGNSLYSTDANQTANVDYRPAATLAYSGQISFAVELDAGRTGTIFQIRDDRLGAGNEVRFEVVWNGTNIRVFGPYINGDSPAPLPLDVALPGFGTGIHLLRLTWTDVNSRSAGYIKLESGDGSGNWTLIDDFTGDTNPFDRDPNFYLISLKHDARFSRLNTDTPAVTALGQWISRHNPPALNSQTFNVNSAGQSLIIDAIDLSDDPINNLIVPGSASSPNATVTIVNAGKSLQVDPNAGFTGATAVTFTLEAGGDANARTTGAHTVSWGGFVDLGADPQAGQTHHASVMDALKLTPYRDVNSNIVATHWTAGNGNASDPNTWAQGAVPGDGAKVIVQTGHTVTNDITQTARWHSVRVDGGWETSTTKDTHLRVEHFVVAPGGSLKVGTLASPMPAAIKAKMEFLDAGDLEIAVDEAGIGRGVVGTGDVQIHGAVKSHFHRGLTKAGPIVGATSMTLDSAPTGWRVGDRIVLGATQPPPPGQADADAGGDGAVHPWQRYSEVVTLTAINGADISWLEPCQYDHSGKTLSVWNEAGQMVGTVDKTCFVDNLTRNIEFFSESTSTFRRGHGMVTGHCTGFIRYASFTDMGRTDKNVADGAIGDGIDYINAGTRAPDNNIRGRYSLHLHHNMEPFFIEGCAGEGSPGWLFTQHGGAFHTLKFNVGYDAFSSCFFAEDGDEDGHWFENSGGYVDGRNGQPKTGITANNNPGRVGQVFGWRARNILDERNRAHDFGGGYGSVYHTRNGFDVAAEKDWLQGRLAQVNTIDNDEIHIRMFGFEAVGGYRGIEVAKASPIMKNFARSHMNDVFLWSVRDGFKIGYGGHYTLTRWSVDATEIGIYFFKNSLDFVMRDCVIQNCTVQGFKREPRTSWTSNFNAPTLSHELYLLNVVFLNCTSDHNTMDPLDVIDASPGAKIDPPTITLDQAIYYADDVGTELFGYTVTDSIGARNMPETFWEIPATANQDLLEWANSADIPADDVQALIPRGWWDYSGERVVVLPLAYSARDGEQNYQKDLVVALSSDVYAQMTLASSGTYNPASPIFG